MSHAILHEEWSEYDDRKIRDRRDGSKFSCEEAWEVSYLVGKLKKHFPHQVESAIRAAIASCCLSIPAPHPREKFVSAVIEKLK